jgi:hypothetical protein
MKETERDRFTRAFGEFKASYKGKWYDTDFDQAAYEEGMRGCSMDAIVLAFRDAAKVYVNPPVVAQVREIALMRHRELERRIQERQASTQRRALGAGTDEVNAWRARREEAEHMREVEKELALQRLGMELRAQALAEGVTIAQIAMRRYHDTQQTLAHRSHALRNEDTEAPSQQRVRKTG